MDGNDFLKLIGAVLSDKWQAITEQQNSSANEQSKAIGKRLLLQTDADHRVAKPSGAVAKSRKPQIASLGRLLPLSRSELASETDLAEPQWSKLRSSQPRLKMGSPS